MENNQVTTKTNTTAAETAQATNSLKHFIYTKDKDGNDLTITIRLDDECNNGHQDFAITANSRKGGYSGCCHTEILEVVPELKLFVDLHLSDAKGVPMCAVENGFYHLTNNMERMKFCEYYRVTPEQYDVLAQSKDRIQFAICIEQLGVLAQWQAEAETAINELERLTGKSFVNDSVKSNFHAPTQVQIAEMKAKIESGYYTPEGERKRNYAKLQTEIAKLESIRNETIENAKAECDIKTQVLQIGGKSALDASIVYKHTKTLAFNWNSFNRITPEQFATIASNIILPDGYTITLKDGE